MGSFQFCTATSGIPSRVTYDTLEQHVHGGQLTLGNRPLDCSNYEIIVVLVSDFYHFFENADSHCTDYRGGEKGVGEEDCRE